MFLKKLQIFIDRYEAINIILSSNEISSDIKKMTKLSKEQSEISEIVDKSKNYIETFETIKENKTFFNDPELGDIAKEENNSLNLRLSKLEDELKFLMIPVDKNDNKNIFLELRAGTGGEESALFVADIFKMYARYSEKMSWNVEIISSSDGVSGGYKEMIALIKGKNVYSKLKYEAGIHRVQRVPTTETQGRVHTSAITVAIIPEIDDVEVDIKENDIKVDVYRSSGCGGQSVNTTDSAVRLTHIPTGVVVSIQDEKSQHKNKDKAMKVLKARVHKIHTQEQLDETSKQRKLQVGSGDRSEKIRTYNFPQNRLTDHRMKLTLYSLDSILNDGKLELVINPLISYFRAEVIKNSEI